MIHLIHISTRPITLHFLRGQTAYLRKRNFIVSAISSPTTSLSRSVQNKTVHYFPVFINETILPFLDCISIFKIYKILKKIKPTIVQTHTPKASLLGLCAARVAGIRVKIFQVHGLYSYSKQGMAKTFYILLEKITCAFSDKVFCVSHTLKKYMINNTICREDKIIVFGSGSIDGLDTQHFDPKLITKDAREKLKKKLRIPLDATVIGFVGRIVSDKGIDEIMASWHLLKKKYPTTYLIFVGDTEKNDPLDARIADETATDPQIRVTHWVRDPRQYYAIMDLLLLPSYREGIPYSILEAQSMEVPVIASDISGNNEIIVHNVNGMLVSKRSSRELYNALVMYMQNPQLRKKHGKRGRKIISQKFKQAPLWHQMYTEYIHLINTYA